MQTSTKPASSSPLSASPAKTGEKVVPAQSLKRRATPESLAAASSPNCPLPWGGLTVIDGLGSGSSVTNCWVFSPRKGPAKVVLAEDSLVVSDREGITIGTVRLFGPSAEFPISSADVQRDASFLENAPFVKLPPEFEALVSPVRTPVGSPLPGGTSGPEYVLMAPYRINAQGCVYRAVTAGKVLGRGMYDYDEQGEPKYSFAGVEYRTNTIPGDCGTPVIGQMGIIASHLLGLSNSNAGVLYSGLSPSAVEGSSRLRLRGRLEMLRTRRASVSSATSAQSKVSKTSKTSKTSKKGSKKVESGKRKVSFPDANPSPLKRARKEDGGLVSMSPAPSDYLGTSRTGSGSVLTNYVDMLVNPWSGRMQRLPDTCITPTSLIRLFANRTYPLGNGGDVIIAMHSRLSAYNTVNVTEASNVYLPAVGAATGSGVYPYTPGCILKPIRLPISNTCSGSDAYYDGTTLASSPRVWQDDFGGQFNLIPSYTSGTRCLALAIRVRIVGLPDSVFMAPGKVYFAQLRWNADEIPLDEQQWSLLESRGRATHVSTDAIRAAGSKTFFSVPDSEDKFVFSSQYLPPPGVFFKDTSPLTTEFGVRRFPTHADGTGGYQRRANTVGTTSLVGVRPVDLIAPYASRIGTSDAGDAPTSDQTWILVIGVFGANSNTTPGVTLEVNYAHIAETIPANDAPPGTETAIQLPDGKAMDEIFAAAAVLADLRPSMVQASGDRTLIGTVATSPFGKASHTESSRTKSVILERISKAKGTTRVRREGIWDTLSNMAGAAAGAFADEMTPRRRRSSALAPKKRRSRYDSDDDDY